MCHAHQKKCERETTKEIEQNQESIRMLGEKENFEYLEILEAETLKKWK